MTTDEFHKLPINSQTNALRNILVSLRHHRVASFRWEEDTRLSNATGEVHGEWSVYAVTCGGEEIELGGEEIDDLLVELDDRASKISTAEYRAYEAKRKAALDKLTPEDKKLLNL